MTVAVVVSETALVIVEGTVTVAVEGDIALPHDEEPKGVGVSVTVDAAGQVEPLALAVTVTVAGSVAELAMVVGTVMVVVEAGWAPGQEDTETIGVDTTVKVEPTRHLEPLAWAVTVTIDGGVTELAMVVGIVTVVVEAA